MHLPTVAEIPLTDLNPFDRNARKHSKKQINQIAKSIQEFGFTNPILIDQSNTILAGHGRVAAALSLRMDHVPCLYIEHLSQEQKRAFVLADNQIALNSTWDEDLLGRELKALSEIDLGFDLDITGFSIADMDVLIEDSEPEEDYNPSDDIQPKTIIQRAQLGDVWQLGNHRLVCGDSLQEKTLDQLLEGEMVSMVFTDPPYNVKVNGHIGGSGQIKHDEFAMASGEMNQSQFTSFLRSSFESLTRCAKDGSIHYICMDWRHMREMADAADGVYAELKNLIVWAKDNGGMGTFYRSRHELIFVYKFGDAPHINTFELGQHGRYRTNVWEYRGANQDELKMHPTVKPVQMIADAIKDASARSDIILDLFGGSGSTLIAAEKTGRHARLCELDPKYCDLIIARWERYAKDTAELIDRPIALDVAIS
jgi:DNA modification methylase